MADSYFPREQRSSRQNLVRCPYCVEDGNFKEMKGPEGGSGHTCNRCGHVVLPANPLFECSCGKCARFKISS